MMHPARKYRIRSLAQEIFEGMMYHEPSTEPTKAAEKSIKAAAIFFQTQDEMLGPEFEDAPNSEYLDAEDE